MGVDGLRRVGVVVRAHLAAWRLSGRHVRARHGHTLTSVALVVLGLGGALAGGALVGEWCLGLVLIAESALAVYVGFGRDDGKGAPRGRDWETVPGILERARRLP
jgi:hypothetical protein